MIKLEYFCTCPICKKQIVGKNLYKKHITAEVEETIDKLNEIMPDLKEYGMSITSQETFNPGINYLVLNNFKSKEEEK